MKHQSGSAAHAAHSGGGTYSHGSRRGRFPRPSRGVLIAACCVAAVLVVGAVRSMASETNVDVYAIPQTLAIAGDDIADATYSKAVGAFASSGLIARDLAQTSAMDEEARAASIDSTAITVSGADRSKALANLGYLTEAIQAIEEDGYTVGFEFVDVATGVTVSYDADTTYYSASSIKGPYVLYLEQNVVGDDQGSLSTEFRSTIVESDNDAYTTLRNTYGSVGFASWVKDAGVNLADTDVYTHYAHYSSHELRLLWSASYPYLISDEPGAEWCREVFSQPEVSPIREVLEGSYTTWSKAGWYDAADGYGSQPVTCVGGVVRATTGDYVVAIMSNEPACFEPLYDVVAALDDVHTDLTS